MAFHVNALFMYAFKCQGNFYVMNILSILEGSLSKIGESLKQSIYMI